MPTAGTTLEGFEPSVSTLKGWRAGPLHHRVSGRKREYRTASALQANACFGVLGSHQGVIENVGMLYTCRTTPDR